VLGWSPGENDA
jgi:hypothetical protein